MISTHSCARWNCSVCHQTAQSSDLRLYRADDHAAEVLVVIVYTWDMESPNDFFTCSTPPRIASFLSYFACQLVSPGLPGLVHLMCGVTLAFLVDVLSRPRTLLVLSCCAQIVRPTS